MLLECCGFDTVTPIEKKGTNDTESSDDKTLECDYDVNPTVLYQAIEDKAWGPSMKIVSPPKDSKIKYEPGESPAEQARTWVSRHEKNGDLRWSQLPLHAAIIFGAPYGLVEKLVQLYPQALKSKDDQAMLPLHLTFRYGSSDDIVYLLLEKYPNAINVRGHKNRLPLECSRKSGPNNKRALIIQAFTSRMQKELDNRATTTQRDMETRLNQRVLQLETDLENLKKENEHLKYASSDEALQQEKDKVVELQKHIDVLTSANKMLAMSDAESRLSKVSKLSNEEIADREADPILANRSIQESRTVESAAAAATELAMAQARAEVEKKEAQKKLQEGQDDKIEELRNISKDESKLSQAKSNDVSITASKSKVEEQNVQVEKAASKAESVKVEKALSRASSKAESVKVEKASSKAEESVKAEKSASKAESAKVESADEVKEKKPEAEDVKEGVKEEAPAASAQENKDDEKRDDVDKATSEVEAVKSNESMSLSSPKETAEIPKSPSKSLRDKKKMKSFRQRFSRRKNKNKA